MNDLFALMAISKSTIEKKRRKNNENDKDAFHQIWFERDVLMSLHHPLLPSLCGLVETEKVVGFLMDWCIGKDLGSLRRRQMERIFSEEYIRLIFDKRKNLNLHLTSDQSTVAIKKSFGKFDDVLQPGCHCLLWVFGQQVVGYLSLRVQQLDVRCETKAKDSKDEKLLREILYDAVILVDYSFLNPGMNMDQCYDFMRCIAFRRLMVTHDSIRIASEKGDHGKAMSYMSAISTSCPPDQIIKWVANQSGIERMKRPDVNTPQVLLDDQTTYLYNTLILRAMNLGIPISRQQQCEQQQSRMMEQQQSRMMEQLAQLTARVAGPLSS